jgi:hypothetical protein
MNRLGLDDPAWAHLDQRNGSAEWVPGRLAHLLSHPEDTAAFSELWPHLASEGSAYSAGHAALPYVLDIAERLPPGMRAEYLAFVGILLVGTDQSVRREVRDAYEASLPRALELVVTELPFHHTSPDTRFLLATTAALKGYPKVADVLQALDVLMDCPACGEKIEEIEG